MKPRMLGSFLLVGTLLAGVLLALAPPALQAASLRRPQFSGQPIHFSKASGVFVNVPTTLNHSGEFGLHSPYRRKLFDYEEGQFGALIANVGFFVPETPLVFYWKIDGVAGEFYSDAPNTDTFWVTVQAFPDWGEFWDIHFTYSEELGKGVGLEVFAWLPRLQLPFDRAAQPGPCGMTEFPQLQLYCVNSFFDHDSPDYHTNGELQRFFGSPVDASRCNASVPALRWFCYDGHNGYDFRLVPSPDPMHPSQASLVLAADYGLAERLPDDPYLGTGIRISHPTGYYTEYWHLSRSLIDGYAFVDAGTPIGVVGCTGSNCTGPHLHFEVRVNDMGAPQVDPVVDPFAWRGTGPDPYAATGHGWCLWKDGCPATVVTQQDGGLLATESGDISVLVPGFAVTQDTILQLDLGPSPEAQPSATFTKPALSASAESDTIPAGYFFSLSAEDLSGAPVESFSVPMTITINYTDTLESYVSEDSLTIQSWTDASGIWQPLATTLDVVANTATASTDHLSLFALVGTPSHDRPVVTAVTPTIVTNNLHTTITVTGADFLPLASLELGPSPLPVTLVTSDTLTATVPSGFPPGGYAVSVVNPDTQATTWLGPLTVRQPFFLPLILENY